MRMKANVVPNITGRIQGARVKPRIREELSKYRLADTIPTSTETTYIDLLIGNDYADIVSLQRVNIYDGLYLLQSKFVWILSGRMKESTSPSNDYCAAVNMFVK